MSKVKPPAKFDYNNAAPFDRLVEALREIAGGKICKPKGGTSKEGEKCGCLEFALRAIVEREGMDPEIAREDSKPSFLSDEGLAWFGLNAGVWERNDWAHYGGLHTWPRIFEYIATHDPDFACAWTEAQRRGI